jgi:Holliday junction resolvase-like predicted endonuclease
MITIAIQDPELIGIRGSEKIDWAYSYGSDDKSSIHKLPNRTTQGIFVKNLLSFRRSILESKNWPELRTEAETLRDFLLPLKEIFLCCYKGVLKNGKIVEVDETLKVKIPGILLIFLNDENNLAKAFSEMYRTQKSGRIRLEDFAYDLADQLSETFNENALMKNQVLFSGFRFANLALWYYVLGDTIFNKYIEIFHKLKEAPDWKEFDLLFEKINDQIIFGFEKEHQSNFIDFTIEVKIPRALRVKLTVPIEKTKATRILLEEVLNHRPAKAVSFEGPAGFTNFQTVLLGLIGRQMIKELKEKAQIVEFVHRRGKSKNYYSYGLFLPTYLAMGDASIWWIFYGVATDYSGAGRHYYLLIHRLLDAYKPFIRCRKFSIPENDLLTYLKSDYLTFIEKECNQAREVNWLLRGAFLELLVATYFSKKGFKILLRHKSKIIGKEIDVVAIKHSSKMNLIYLVECKERSITSESSENKRLEEKLFKKLRKTTKGDICFGPTDLIVEAINEFVDKCYSPLKEKLPLFINEIGIRKAENSKLIGILATTENCVAPKTKMLQGIELWTWWTLKDIILKEKISRSYLEIIQKHLEGEVGRPIQGFDFNKDYFD